MERTGVLTRIKQGFRAVGYRAGYVRAVGIFNAVYSAFKRSVSSGGDFNAVYAVFRRSVSQCFERWGSKQTTFFNYFIMQLK